MKIAVVVEQRRAVFDAPRADQEIDCRSVLSVFDPFLAQQID